MADLNETQRDIARMERWLFENGISTRAFLFGNDLVAHTTWCRWKSGKADPMLQQWRDVCAAFDKTRHELADMEVEAWVEAAKARAAKATRARKRAKREKERAAQ